MDTLFVVWLVFHVLVCFALVVVVLMQSSKGEGLAGSTFSGGVGSAVFGGRGVATLLSKATTVLAVLFMVNCAALAFMSAQPQQTTDLSNVTTSTVTEKARQEMTSEQRAIEEAQQRLAADTAGKSADTTR